ncbi:MAG: polyprenyl synthetase family protein [Calditrichaceae bacterium]|nr:polyprenyl synthetase family protein [Calditrichaceae bacterium]
MTASFKDVHDQYLAVIEDEMARIDSYQTVPLFYDPIQYMLDLKGKRIRPLLTLLSAMAFGAKVDEAKYAAAAVELLHNFTLVHDDIMDNDATRRGKPTIHTKWDIGTAILAGDGLMGLAFRKLLQSPRGNIPAMMGRLTETMIVICEGQGLDKMFENMEDVSLDTYLDMIARKTAVLIEMACELGGMAAEANNDSIQILKEFGYALGMGFQIQDDYLDITADESILGKKIGSDLQMRKKTILTILLRELTGSNDFFEMSLPDFKTLMEKYEVPDRVNKMYLEYFSTAYNKLAAIPHNDHTIHLKELTDFLRNRSW